MNRALSRVVLACQVIAAGVAAQESRKGAAGGEPPALECGDLLYDDGPHRGRKLFTLQTLPTCVEEDWTAGDPGNVAGFSLHAGVAVKGSQHKKPREKTKTPTIFASESGSPLAARLLDGPRKTRKPALKNQDTHEFRGVLGVAANDSAAKWAEIVFRKGVFWRSGQQKALRRSGCPASRQPERPERPVYESLVVGATRQLAVPGAS